MYDYLIHSHRNLLVPEANHSISRFQEAHFFIFSQFRSPEDFVHRFEMHARFIWNVEIEQVHILHVVFDEVGIGVGAHDGDVMAAIDQLGDYDLNWRN